MLAAFSLSPSSSLSPPVQGRLEVERTVRASGGVVEAGVSYLPCRLLSEATVQRPRVFLPLP